MSKLTESAREYALKSLKRRGYVKPTERIQAAPPVSSEESEREDRLQNLFDGSASTKPAATTPQGAVTNTETADMADYNKLTLKERNSLPKAEREEFELRTYDFAAGEEKSKQLKAEVDAAKSDLLTAYYLKGDAYTQASKVYDEAKARYDAFEAEHRSKEQQLEHLKIKDSVHRVMNTNTTNIDAAIGKLTAEQNANQKIVDDIDSQYWDLLGANLSRDAKENERYKATIDKRTEANAKAKENKANIYYLNGIKSFSLLTQEQQEEIKRLYGVLGYAKPSKDESNANMKAAWASFQGSGMSQDDYFRMVETLQAMDNALTSSNAEIENAKFANEHPITASTLSVFANLLGGVVSVADVASQTISSIGAKPGYVKPIDTSASTFALTKAATTARGEVSEKIERDVGGMGGKVASFLYQTGMSAADSLTASFTGNWGGALLLGSGAASNAFLDAKERGVSDSQAIWTGLLAGTFESLFERVSIGNLNALKETPVGTVKDILKSVAKSSLVNATEEGLTEAANMISDSLINGDLSKYSVLYNDLIASNISITEAKSKVKWTMLADLGLAVASGAIMGIGFGGVGGTINYAANRDVNTVFGALYFDESGNINNEATKTLIEKGLSSDKDDLRGYAKSLQKKGDKVDVKQLGALHRALVATGINPLDSKSAPKRSTNNAAQQETSAVVDAKQASEAENTPKTETAAESEKSSVEDTPIFTDELDEIASTELPEVAVGDEFTQNDTGNTVRVVGRGDTHTTIEITSKNGTETRKITNKVADGYLHGDNFEKVEKKSAQEDANAATDTVLPNRGSIAVGEVYKDNQTGQTLRIVSRDATHIVVEVSNGSSTWTNKFPNGFADTLKQSRYTQLTQSETDIASTVNTKNGGDAGTVTDKKRIIRAKKGDWAAHDISWWAPNSKTVIAYSTVATSDLIETMAENNPKLTIVEIYNAITFDAEAKKVLQAYINCGFGNEVASEHFVRNKNAIASVANESDVEYNEDTTQTDEVADHFAEIDKKRNAIMEKYGLTEEEAWAVEKYKSSESYKINAILRDGGELNDMQKRIVTLLDSALEKLPVFKGKTYRTVSFDDASDAAKEYNDFVELHGKDNFVYYTAYTSASSKFDGHPLADNTKYGVTLEIESKTARDLDGFGNNFEKEVVFARDSYFIVKNVSTDQNGHLYLSIEEVTNNGLGMELHTEEHGKSMQPMQTSHTGNDNVQGVSDGNTQGDSIGQTRPQEPVQGGQRDTVRGEVKLTDKCKLVATKHTQTGKPLWVVSVKERLAKDEYSRLLDIVKKHGGYFSSAAKSLDGNKLSGFIFKEQPSGDTISAINEFFGEPESVNNESESSETSHSPALNNNYTLVKTKNTNTGDDTWLIKVKDRSQAYKLGELKEFIKDYDGRYAPALNSLILNKEPGADVINALNNLLSEDEPENVRSAETETTTTKEGNDNVHDGLLERPSEDDNAGRESEPVPENEEERNTGSEDREPRKDGARSDGELLQTAEENTPAGGQLDSRDNNNRVRESDDSEGHGAAGTSGNDNVDVVESSGKNKDFVITKAVAEDLDTSVPSMDDNIKAIETLHTIESSGKSPTKAQQGLLAKFKGWGGLAGSFYGANRNKLSELMSEDELKAAQGTVNDAYFTPTSIIDSIYKALSHLGFEGGNILEPSMGVGNFFGRMPKSVKDSSFLFGVEIDSISGRIAQQLYPSANIEIAPFQDVAYKDGAFDLIIGNVPFGEVKYKYKGKKYLIHDYFFVKAMDKLSDGGVLAFLTTKGTLDKLDSGARTELSNQGKIIGAFRLPSNVFSRSAGANVVTDLIILQKTSDNSGESFINLGSTEVGGDTFSINEYFVKHPENIIGELVTKRDWRSGKTELDVKATGDVAEQLAKAIKKLPKNLLGGVHTVGNVDVTESNAPMHKFSVTESGEVEYIDSATGEVKQIKGKSADVAKGYITLKDAYQDLIDATLSEKEASTIEEKRKALNVAYDGFVKKHGTLEKNKKVLSADNDFYKLSGLEVYDTKTKRIVKSEMFTKDTLGKRKLKKADNALDALSISIGETGGVNLARIASLTGLTESEAAKQLEDRIIYTPDGTYELNEVYLSGNVREKYEAVKGKKGFEKNEKMLKAVLPEDIPAKNITPQFGAPWIKPAYVADFLSELLHLYKKPVVNYDTTTGTWSVSGDTWGDNTLITSKYGTKFINALSLAEKTLNMRQIVIRDKEQRVLVVETRAAQQKAEDIKAAFEEWCFKDADRRTDLVATFNEKFNANRNMDFSELAKYLTFDGLTDTFKLRDYQKRAVARAIFNGNTLLAHGVGTGKTAEMIAIAMELKRMGIAKKNMMVVPPHKVADFRNDILKMYPSAKVAMLEKGANATQRQRFYALVASNDFDIVIIPHSSFGMLDVSADTKKAFINNQIAELEEVLTAAQEEKGKIDNRFIRQLENQKDRLEEKLKFVTETEKDGGNTFEELGVDSLFVDEAHNFKNLPFYSKLSRVAGVSVNQSNNKTRASRAENMFMITDYLNRSGGRITFGTATPITNSMSEIYNMMRFLRPDILTDAGLQSFDAWASMFGSIVNQAEVDPSGRNMRMKERFSKFKNVSQMIEQFRRMADILKTGDVIQELPEVERIDVVNESNNIQEEFLDIIDEMIDDIRANGQRADHNMLEITTAGQMAAVDLRFVASYFDGKYTIDDLNIPNNRTTQVATRVYEEYVNSNATKGTQFVFCDVGVNEDPSKKYNFYVYGDLINKLVSFGMPRNEIAIAQDFEDKADLSARVNTGEIRVLIGSTAVMGEGMNAQNKAVALHHMTVPARPSDIEQREGRIVRFGNENKNVRIYRYIQEKSYDSYQWQMQERKANFINQALSGGTVEELEEMSDFQLSAREAKAIASGNPLLLEKIEVEDKLNKLKSLRNKFNTDKLEMQDRLSKLPSQITLKERVIADTSADVKTIAENTPTGFEITIGKLKYNERAKAAEALKKCLQNAPRNGTRIKIGSYRGLDLYYVSSFDKGTHYILKGNGEYVTQSGESAAGNITRIANLAEKVGGNLESEKARLANYKAEIETLKTEVVSEFPQTKELEELQAKLNDIDTQLGINVSTVDMSEVIVDNGTSDGDGANYSLESENYHEQRKRNVLSDGSNGRDLGSRSGKQIAELDKTTEASQKRSLKAEDRKAYTEKLTANQLEQRTERDSKGRMHQFFAIKRSAWNDNMRDVADYYEQRGLNVQFLKGNIRCAFVGNEYEARAMQKGDTLYVRYDHEYYSPEQLAEHEYIEANFDSEDVQEAKKQILDKMSDTEYNKAIESLKEQYKGITDDIADLERELVCNVLSGMYAGSAAYSDTVTEFWAKDESISHGYNAATYSDMSDAGGNVDFVDAIGYGSDKVVEEGAQSDGSKDTEGMGADEVRQDNDSIWQRIDGTRDTYQKLGTSEEPLAPYQGDGGYRYIDWSSVLANFDVLKPSDKENAYGLLRAISGLELSSFDQQGRLLTDGQKRYFAKTVAKNSIGELITLYHATNSEFDVFEYGDFGYHVGDFRQAGSIEAKYIKEVYINLQNPFYVDFDDGIWMGVSIAKALLDQGFITQDEYNKLRTLNGFIGNDANSEANIAIKELMRECGFDGIVYKNGFESDGLSFILFDSNQIKYTSNKNPSKSKNIRYSLDTYDKDVATLTPERWNEIFEDFDEDKTSPTKVSVKQAFGERAAWVAHNMTRVFPDIPERGERGTFFAEFRKMMIQWKGLANTSSFMVQDKLNQMTEGLSPEEFDTFSKLVYFLDLQEEAQIQAEKGYAEILLPRNLKPHEVDIIVKKLTDGASENVKQALVKRQSIWDELKAQYVSLNQYIGFETDGKFKRKNYYHHQVIEYMGKDAKGTGNRDISVKAGRGWLKERQGSTKAINTDFLAVEYKALLQMQYDVYVANMLGKIKQKYDIKPQLEREAFENNKSLINGIIKSESTNEDGTTRLDSKGKPDSDTYRQQKWFNQRIMYGFSGLFDLADRGELPTFNGHYAGVVDALKYQNLRVFGLYKYIGELASVELLNDASEEVKQAVISARSVLKYTSQKKAWVKSVLGDNYQTWETLAKSMSDTHTIHQPRRGNYFYTKTTIDEDAFNRGFEEMIATLASGTSGIESIDGIKQLFMQYSETVRLMGAAYEQWVLPNEIVTTIDSIANPKQTGIGIQSARAIVSAWKGWATSVNPLRTVKFGIRNVFGDVDAVIAGNPGVVKHSKRAVHEIYQAMRYKKYSPEFMEWVERGGYSSTIFANEMDSEMQDKLFAHLKEKEGSTIFKSVAKAFEGYYDGVKLAHDFREAILRYSSYLYFKDEIQKNGGDVKDNVASNRYIIKGLTSVEDKAYQLSKDLLGAYDEVGMMGQTLRRYWVPFYSFTETNLKRYYRMFENIIMSDASIPEKAGKLLLKGLMVNLIALLMLAWNKFVMKEEDDKLPPATRNIPHITLGQIGDDVIAFRQLGSFSEILEWFGLEDYKWTSEDLTAPLDKAWGMITPFVKMPVELASGLNFYPSLTEPQTIRDRAQHFFNSLGVSDIYDIIAGKPTKGIGEVLKGAFVYSYDYQESAYYEILDIKRNYQGKTDNTIYGADEKSNALYYMKRAIKLKDKKAALKYLNEYFENGGTGKGIKQSFATLNPMYGYTSKDTYEKGQAFIASLTEDEKEKLKLAQTYYENELGLPESISNHLKNATVEQAKNLLTNYINSQCK